MDIEKATDKAIDEGFEYLCKECLEGCEVFEDSFDYSGTHCSNGASGTHHTGFYQSRCCHASYEEI